MTPIITGLEGLSHAGRGASGAPYEDFYVPFDVSFRARISDFSFWMSIRRQPAEIRLPQIEMQKVEMDLYVFGANV